ncbi:MAG: efflux RND transporter permease subunit [Rhodospirillales bacterium]
MVLSDTSIKRPVFATVMSLLLVVLGIASLMRLPVREYPAIDPPIVSVTTVYKGASNDVVESQVTEIIEASVAGIEGIKTITSTSREERSQVQIEFTLARDVEAAANDVRDRVFRVLNRLPDAIEQPRIAKIDSDARAIVWFLMTSDRFSHLELTDIAQRRLLDRLSIVPGVANVYISGERRFAIRIWLDRQAMSARGLTVEDLEAAVRRNNVELPGGRLESTAREFTVKTDARLRTPDQFARVVVANKSGYQIRLGEIAQVELAPEDTRSEMRSNGRSAIGVGVVKQSTANTLDVANGAKAEMALLQPTLPPGIDVAVGYDESTFVDRSIFEVNHALAIGLAMVVGVIFIFLRSVRATIIPAVAIPVSIVGSFVVLSAFGFSINVLTLLAFVLAIGIVVDDAIVVLENIHRRIEEGEPPLLAAIRGGRQIAFAVIATTLVLASVFVPLSFMEGNTGRLFTEFGIALAAAVLFSGFVALSLTPMMCSKLLRPVTGESFLYKITEPVFEGMINGYRWLLRGALRAPLLIIAVSAGGMALSYTLFMQLPKEFVPTEDRGYLIVPVTAPEGASMEYTRDHVAKIEQILQPLIERGEATVIMGNVAPGLQRPAPVNTGHLFVKLTDWSERERKQQDIVKDVAPKINAIPGVRAFPVNPPSLGQRGFRPPIQLVLGGSDYETLVQWRDRMMARMREEPRFLNVTSNYQENKPEIRVAIDRLRAADLGVSLDQIGRTLEVMFGSREVGTYVDKGEEYKVIAQATFENRRSTRDLTNVFVRSATSGQLIPLSNLVSIGEAAGPQELNRTDRLRSITVQASLAPGYPLGQAITELEAMTRDVLPAEAVVSWQGESRDFKESSDSLYFTFGLALLVVFLVLAAQFESYIHPLIIMLSVPIAVTGSLAALLLVGYSLNIYSQIGMILLIGLMAKNGILIVEFANQLRDDGKSIYDAVLEASVIRLRPILMTSIATVVGALPLAIAAGAGAESRSAIGVVIIGGVLVATVFTLFLIPALYLLLARFTRPINHVAQRLSQMERQPHAAE